MTSKTPHEALIFVMILTSAADSDMTDAELNRIGNLVQTLPIFRDFDRNEFMKIARECQRILQHEDGLDEILDMIKAALPQKAYDTAYALAVDVAAADLDVKQEELRVLQMLRDRLDLDKLTVAAIERGARARFRIL